MALYIVGEGQGEQDALPTLIYRMRDHLGLELPHHGSRHSWKKLLLTQPHIHAVCGQVRTTSDCDALLLTRDSDNAQLRDADCPRFTAPEIAGWVRALQLPFPTAVVLFYREYETLFLAGAEGMAGRDVLDHRNRISATIPADATAHPSPEHPRDAKGWVRSKLVTGYKPVLFQASLTRMLDLDVMESTGLSSYRRLVRALRFLSTNLGAAGAVYPPSTQKATDG